MAGRRRVHSDDHAQDHGLGLGVRQLAEELQGLGGVDGLRGVPFGVGVAGQMGEGLRRRRVRRMGLAVSQVADGLVAGDGRGPGPEVTSLLTVGGQGGVDATPRLGGDVLGVVVADQALQIAQQSRGVGVVKGSEGLAIAVLGTDDHLVMGVRVLVPPAVLVAEDAGWSGSACSPGAFGTSAAEGSVGGAVAFGAVALLPETLAGWATGAIAGGASGAAGYGTGCALGSECSLTGLAEATVFGGALGAAFGAAGDALQGCGESFTPDTKVQLADGSGKAIGDLKAGDKVKSTDTATGKTKDSLGRRRADTLGQFQRDPCAAVRDA